MHKVVKFVEQTKQDNLFAHLAYATLLHYPSYLFHCTIRYPPRYQVHDGDGVKWRSKITSSPNSYVEVHPSQGFYPWRVDSYVDGKKIYSKQMPEENIVALFSHANSVSYRVSSEDTPPLLEYIYPFFMHAAQIHGEKDVWTVSLDPMFSEKCARCGNSGTLYQAGSGCGHVCLCPTCAQNAEGDKCPICYPISKLACTIL